MATSLASKFKSDLDCIDQLAAAYNKLQLPKDTNLGLISFKRLAQLHAIAVLPKHNLNGNWDGEYDLLHGQKTLLVQTFVNRYSVDVWGMSTVDFYSRPGLGIAVEEYFVLLIRLPVPAIAAHESVEKLLGGTASRRASVGAFEPPPDRRHRCIMESCTKAFATYTKLSDHIEKMHLND